MKLLDAGRSGSSSRRSIPGVDSERLVHHANYAPAGTRSFGPTLAMMIYGAD